MRRKLDFLSIPTPASHNVWGAALMSAMISLLAFSPQTSAQSCEGVITMSVGSSCLNTGCVATCSNMGTTHPTMGDVTTCGCSGAESSCCHLVWREDGGQWQLGTSGSCGSPCPAGSCAINYNMGSGEATASCG